MGIVGSIKQAASENRTTIQTSEAQALEKILNGMFYSPKKIEEESGFVRQVMTRGADTQERVGLHASALIVSENKWCLRQQVLSLLYKQLQGDQVNVDLRRIFEEGNAVHEKWQRLFIRAGYADVGGLDVTQYNEELMVSYTPDIICEIKEFYDGEMVGELKSVNTYQFQKMSKHPSASKQLQLYMRLSGIKKGFVLSEDKNTQCIKVEVYDYDPAISEPAIGRCKAVKKAYKRAMVEHKMVPRPEDATSPLCKRCGECPMRDACWNIGIGRVRIGSR